MKKFDTLLDAIENGSKNEALRLGHELYNDLRDFSQSIDVTNDEKLGKIVKSTMYRTPEYVDKMKAKIKLWVGGH